MPARITFLIGLVTVSLLLVLAPRTETQSLIPSQGDVYVSLETGLVQWRTPDDTLRAVLVGQIAGPAEGMRFDEGGNLGLAACAGRVLKFSRNQPPVAYSVEPEDRRLLWIDLAGDGCTLFYTSQGLDVKRFDVCTNTQLPNFNLKPMPGETQGLRVLPDGGVLVSSGAVIARLDDAGSLVQVYDVPTRASPRTGSVSISFQVARSGSSTPPRPTSTSSIWRPAKFGDASTPARCLGPPWMSWYDARRRLRPRAA